MTVLQRLAHALKPQARFDANFEHYYSRLLQRGDAAGMPSAQEAQRDFNAMRDQSLAHRYL